MGVAVGTTGVDVGGIGVGVGDTGVGVGLGTAQVARKPAKTDKTTSLFIVVYAPSLIPPPRG